MDQEIRVTSHMQDGWAVYHHRPGDPKALPCLIRQRWSIVSELQWPYDTSSLKTPTATTSVAWFNFQAVLRERWANGDWG
jgi:hypothetical protein